MSLDDKIFNCLLIAAPVAFLGIMISVMYNENKGKKEESASRPIIAQVYEIAAGKDNFLDKKEAGQLIKELHITGAVGEHEMLRISPFGSEIRVYTQGPGGRHNTERDIGYLSSSNLLEFIERHKQERKDD